MVDDLDLRQQFSINIRRTNYIKLMRLRHVLFDDLKSKGVVRNISFDDVICDLLLKHEKEKGDLK